MCPLLKILWLLSIFLIRFPLQNCKALTVLPEGLGNLTQLQTLNLAVFFPSDSLLSQWTSRSDAPTVTEDSPHRRA